MQKQLASMSLRAFKALQGCAMARLEAPTFGLLLLLLALLLKHPELLGRRLPLATLGLELPPSTAFEAAFNGLAALNGGPCVAAGAQHLLHDLSGPLERLTSCQEQPTGPWPRLLQLLRRSWWQLHWRWRPQLLEDLLAQLAARQAEFTALGLAALELQSAAAAGPKGDALRAVLEHERPQAQAVGELTRTVAFSAAQSDLSPAPDATWRQTATRIPPCAKRSRRQLYIRYLIEFEGPLIV